MPPFALRVRGVGATVQTPAALTTAATPLIPIPVPAIILVVVIVRATPFITRSRRALRTPPSLARPPVLLTAIINVTTLRIIRWLRAMPSRRPKLAALAFSLPSLSCRLVVAVAVVVVASSSLSSPSLPLPRYWVPSASFNF